MWENGRAMPEARTCPYSDLVTPKWHGVLDPVAQVWLLRPAAASASVGVT